MLPRIELSRFDMERSGKDQYRLRYDDHLRCNASRHEASSRNSTQSPFDTSSSLGQLFLDYYFSEQINGLKDLDGWKISLNLRGEICSNISLSRLTSLISGLLVFKSE